MNHTSKAERWNYFLPFPELSFHLCLPSLFFLFCIRWMLLLNWMPLIQWKALEKGEDKCLTLNIDEFKWTIDLVSVSHLNLPLELERHLLETMILYYKWTGLSIVVTKLYLKVASLQKICKKNLNWVCVRFCFFFFIYQCPKCWYEIFLLLKVDVTGVFLAVALQE